MEKYEKEAYFIFGYCYALAEDAKKQGLFEDFSTLELAKLYLQNID